MMLRTLAVCMSAVALAQGLPIISVRFSQDTSPVQECETQAMPANGEACMAVFAGDVAAQGDGRTPQPQIPDQNLGLGTMYPGVRVWKDLVESAWKRIPEWLLGVSTTIASSALTGTTEMYWACGRNSPYCEIFTFVYSCDKTCDHESGDIMLLLQDEGFDRISCGPSVHSRTGGGEHQMIAFKRVIASDSDYTLVMSADKTEFVAFALEKNPALCSSLETENLCADTKGKCEWVSDAEYDGADRCVLRQCKRQQYGPGVCTNLCISDDL